MKKNILSSVAIAAVAWSGGCGCSAATLAISLDACLVNSGFAGGV